MKKKARKKREIGAISWEWRKMKTMMRGYLINVANIRQGKIIKATLSYCFFFLIVVSAHFD
jgi:hypothetical protein